MVLVTAYKHLKKRDPGFPFRTFAPLRAVGLAVELGWALAKDLGFPSVTAVDLGRVEVFGRSSGDLLVNGAPSEKCQLQLKQADADLALSVLHRQRALLTDLGFNVWYTIRNRDT